MEKLVRRPQRIILLANCLDIEALLPLVEAASAPTIVLVHGEGSHRYASAQVSAVNSLEEAVEVAESRLSERVFLPPVAANIRENLDIPSLFWLDDYAPRNGADAVYDTTQKAVRSLERRMHQWHNPCAHCIPGKRCADCNEAYLFRKNHAGRQPWLGETRRALVSSHLAAPLLEYLSGRFPEGNGPFSDIAVYGSEAVAAHSTDLPLRTFSSFEKAVDALRHASEVKEEASSTGSTHTPEPILGLCGPDSSGYSDLSHCENDDLDSDAMSVASFAGTDDSLCELRVSTPVPDDFFGPLRDPRIDFPEFHVLAPDAQAQSVNSRSFHCDPATQAHGTSISVSATPGLHPGYGGACHTQPIFVGMVGYGSAMIPMA
jgi:hypothetical protein